MWYAPLALDYFRMKSRSYERAVAERMGYDAAPAKPLICRKFQL